MIQDILIILTKKHLSFRQKLSLIVALMKLRTKRYWNTRFFQVSPHKTKFLGFMIHHAQYDDFYWTFRDVFLDEGYYFKTSEKKPVIFDCGANIGVTTLYFLFLYPKAHITAFEPEKTNLSFLYKNIEHNKLSSQVSVIEKAVSDTEGTLSIYGTGRAVTTSRHLFEKEKEEKETYTSTDTDEVQTVQLSSYITKKVTCLKIDIEGAEHQVLQELDESGVLDMVDAIIIEYHQHDAALPHTKMLQLLERNHFVYQLHYDHLTLQKMASAHYYHFMINAKKKYE